MPFLPQNNFLSEEDKKKQLEQQSNNNMVSGDSGNSFTVGLPNTNSKSAAKQSGSFVNLNKYINANTEQSNQLGSDVSNKIVGLGTEAKNQINTAKDQFSSQVNAGTISNLDNAATDAQNVVNKAIKKQVTDNFTDDELNRFKEVTNATYNGPNQIEDVTDIYNPASQLKDKVNNYSKLSETDEGRSQLLSEIYNRPSYSQGQVTFDNLLLSGNQESKQKLLDARNSVKDVSNVFSDTFKQANDYASMIKGKTDQARVQSQEYTNTNQQNRNKQVQDRLDDVNKNWNNEYNSLVNVLDNSNGGKNLSLTDKQLKQLNVNENQRIYNILNGISGASYITQNAFDANKVISKDEQAQLAALDLLSNQYQGNQLNKYINPDQAGSMTIENAMDASRFGTEAVARQKLFDQYSADANFHADGENSQSWNYGPAGMFRDSLTRKAHLDANLADILKQGGYQTDSTGGSYTNGSLVGIPLNDLLTKGFGSVVDGGGDFWRDGSSEAARAASEAAFNQARGGLFSQIVAALEAQGFNNQIKKNGGQ